MRPIACQCVRSGNNIFKYFWWLKKIQNLIFKNPRNYMCLQVRACKMGKLCLSICEDLKTYKISFLKTQLLFEILSVSLRFLFFKFNCLRFWGKNSSLCRLSIIISQKKKKQNKKQEYISWNILVKSTNVLKFKCDWKSQIAFEWNLNERILNKN